jgi:hypothetical protein
MLHVCARIRGYAMSVLDARFGLTVSACPTSGDLSRSTGRMSCDHRNSRVIKKDGFSLGI